MNNCHLLRSPVLRSRLLLITSGIISVALFIELRWRRRTMCWQYSAERRDIDALVLSKYDMKLE